MCSQNNLRNNTTERYQLWQSMNISRQPFYEYTIYINRVKHRFAKKYPEKVYREYDGRITGILDQDAFTKFIREDLNV